MNIRHRLLHSVVAISACVACALSLTNAARANPEGAQVVAGSAAVTGQGTSTVTVTQSSDKAILNWNSFSIKEGELTQFLQPNAQSIALNRVIGGDPSLIYGSLRANGRLILINPNGLTIGPNGSINANSFIASTVDISDDNFLSGHLTFDRARSPDARIVNEGTVTAAEAGLVAFVAPAVKNTGLIQAKLGTVTLGAANKFTLDFYGDELVSFPVDAEVTKAPSGSSALVEAGGTIEGKNVVLSARAARDVIDNVIVADGTIIARTATVVDGAIRLGGNDQMRQVSSVRDRHESAFVEAGEAAETETSKPGGTIRVDGGSNGLVVISGKMDATGDLGGKIAVTGDAVHLGSSAQLDASGEVGGGTVLVGGDYQGRGTLPTARTTVVAGGAQIAADARVRGNGGSVVIWSDDVTVFAGTISSRGGTTNGDGGTVEVSGKRTLYFSGLVDLTASAGSMGSLLLDPRNIRIVAGQGASITLPGSPSGPLQLTSTSDDSVLSVDTLLQALGLANVTIATGADGTQPGDISVETDIAWLGSNSLSLVAHRDVVVLNGSTIANSGSGNLTLRADSAGTGVGTVRLNGPAAIDFSSSAGTVSLFYNPPSNPAGSAVNASSYTSATNFGGNVLIGSGQLTSYMLVNSASDLQNVRNNLAGTYALGRDIEASATSGWNGGTGFVPIGDGTASFTGVFDGLNHRVNQLFLRANRSFVGLFGINDGDIRNLLITNANVTGVSPGAVLAGILTGWNQTGTISNVNVSGTVSANFVSYINIGGLAGANSSLITDSHSSATVNAGAGAACCTLYASGGLVGVNAGSISRSSATGNVSGDVGDIAGFVGANLGSIDQSFSTGPVTGNRGPVGGFVGWNQGGTITHSYSRGAVNGGSASSDGFGGFVHLNDVGGVIRQSYSTGLVTGSGGVGGFLRAIGFGGGTVTDSYWDTQSSGTLVSAAGTGLTTPQLRSGLPSGFNSSIWNWDGTTNGGYPFLRWERSPIAPASVHIGFGSAGGRTQADINQITATTGNTNSTCGANTAAAWCAAGDFPSSWLTTFWGYIAGWWRSEPPLQPTTPQPDDRPNVPSLSSLVLSRGAVVTQEFGAQYDEASERNFPGQGGIAIHPGVDIAGVPEGATVLSFTNGKVVAVLRDDAAVDHGYGNAVMIEVTPPIDGKPTYIVYAHLKDPTQLTVGSPVTVGVTEIGGVGSTGGNWPAHLHVEIRHFSEWINPSKDWYSHPTDPNRTNVYGNNDGDVSSVLQRDYVDPRRVFTVP